MHTHVWRERWRERESVCVCVLDRQTDRQNARLTNKTKEMKMRKN